MSTATASTRIFQVDRDNLRRHRIADRAAAALDDGEIRVRVDCFAWTANNMTYAVAGDVLGYWQFFPVEDDGGGNWGVIPVWGFADVIESRSADVPQGDRLYGYFPPATTLRMRPVRVSAGSLVDGVDHRQSLPRLYNRYRRVHAETGYDPSHDDATMLLGPLHMTSYVLGHRLQAQDFHGAEQTVIVSASSKTGLGLAFALAGMPDAPPVVGLTSAGNVDFVTSTGLYDAVISYDEIAASLPVRATVVVDMAGNAAIAGALRQHLGIDLTFTLLVGLTHWEDTAGDGTSQRPDPAIQENFFAPSYIQRIAEAGDARKFERQAAAFLRDAADATSQWMSVDRRDGLHGLAGAYPEVRDGTLPPSTGVVVQM